MWAQSKAPFLQSRLAALARPALCGTMHVTLYQPEIAGNVGAVMRSCACFGVGLTLIEPCGFPLGDKRMRRAAMDYAVPGGLQTALDWKTYQGQTTGRQVLLTTKAATPLSNFEFSPDDTLVFGAEGSGVPDFVHASVDARVVIPMTAGARSMNLSNSVAVTLFEALRQTNGLP
jgi:tRNA (cytidine/uridine-2'-O-)-methyltransferase